MRIIRYIFWVIVGIFLIVLALANRGMVELRLIPADLANVLPPSLANLFVPTVPLFVVILFGVILGLIIGFLWEYIRETGIRREAARKSREVVKLEREVKRLKEKTGEGQDDILALLE